MPRSLLLTEIVMKTQNQQVRRGGFAFVLKGELKGTPVALKVLHKVQHNDVRICTSKPTLDLDLFEIGFLQRGIYMANILPWACASSPRNPWKSFRELSCITLHGKWHTERMAKDPKAFYSWDATACKDILNFARALIESRQILEVAEGIRYIHSEDMVHGDLRGVSFFLTFSTLLLTFFQLVRTTFSSMTIYA